MWKKLEKNDLIKIKFQQIKMKDNDDEITETSLLR